MSLLKKIPRTTNVSDQIISLFGANLVAYHKMDELSGAYAFDSSGQGNTGTYSGVVLSNALGFYKTQRRVPYFSGSFINLYSVGYDDDFNDAEGAIGISAKSVPAAWTDGNTHAMFRMLADDNNYTLLAKQASNSVTYLYEANNVTKGQGVASQNSNGWQRFWITWSAGGDYLRYYRNGVLADTEQTGLGVWAGVLSATDAVIGAYNTSALAHWIGWLQDFTMLNRAITPAEVLQDYNLVA